MIKVSLVTGYSYYSLFKLDRGTAIIEGELTTETQRTQRLFSNVIIYTVHTIDSSDE